jgi:hypothetical protein
MRVRKSVPEGYKTGNSYGAYKLWSDSDSTNTGGLRVNTSSAAAQREVLPFCGINKVGGLGTQQETRGYTAGYAQGYAYAGGYMQGYEDDDVPSLSDVPLLTNSEESNTSINIAYSNIDSTAPPYSSGARPIATPTTRKRFFDEEDRSEEPVRVWRDHDAWLDGEVSPRSVAPSGWGNARAMAVPRTKSRRSGREGVGLGASMSGASMGGGKSAKVSSVDVGGFDWGQENVEMVFGEVGDFEEAEFLTYRGDMDMTDA